MVCALKWKKLECINEIKHVLSVMDNMKVAREMRERESFDQAQFRRAGRGPLIKTYPIGQKSGKAVFPKKTMS